MEIFSHSPLGYDGDLIRVEIDIRKGIPGFDIVGLPDNAIKESRDRVRAALRNAGFKFPPDRVLINLSPADVKKIGSGFDLALALGILVFTGQVPGINQGILAIGELGLTGELKPVTGILSAVCRALDKGIKHILMPKDQIHEVSVVKNINIWPISGLTDLKDTVNKLTLGQVPSVIYTPSSTHKNLSNSLVWDSFRGHSNLKQALCYTAAGGHHLLMYGPPGGGKTLGAQVLESLLPPLTPQEILEVSRIWSLSGKCSPGNNLITQRPYCSPHHSSSLEGLIGGGPYLRPGEVSLAHRGVLFLDEAPEFSKSILQALREPVQEGKVRILRAGKSYTFPSEFQWVLAANPCPCGNLGRVKGLCLCSQDEIKKYWDRIGGALIDRVEVRIFVESVSAEELLDNQIQNDFEVKREKIQSVRELQYARNGDGVLNSRLSPSEIEKYCTLIDADRFWIGDRMWKEGISSRSLHGILKLARTIADWRNEKEIDRLDLEKAWALRFPPKERQYWDN